MVWRVMPANNLSCPQEHWGAAGPAPDWLTCCWWCCSSCRLDICQDVWSQPLQQLLPHCCAEGGPNISRREMPCNNLPEHVAVAGRATGRAVGQPGATQEQLCQQITEMIQRGWAAADKAAMLPSAHHPTGPSSIPLATWSVWHGAAIGCLDSETDDTPTAVQWALVQQPSV